jgi:uncharacterized protein
MALSRHIRESAMTKGEYFDVHTEPEEADFNMPERLMFTSRALALTRQLRGTFGPLIFHLSGGCCEGSAPMCFRQSDFRVGLREVLLGEIDGCPFYVAPAQYEYWRHCQLTIDLVADGGDSFSLEAAEGDRFIVRSRLFTDAEVAELDAGGPQTGAIGTHCSDLRPVDP